MLVTHKNTRIRKALFAGTAITLGMMSSNAFAQSTASATAADTAEDVTSAGIQDIVVTAQKRSESINDVGMSITAFRSEDLATRGVVDTADLVKVVPGFNYTPSNSTNPVYTIRGIGFFEATLAASPAVAVYVDEVPLAYPAMTKGAGLDLERVEVLKGPQGTLFGQNSTGGAVNYIAAKPTSTPEAGFSATYARFNTFDLQGYASGPLSDTIAVRVAARGVLGGDWQKSYTRDDTNGEEQKIDGRITIDFTPSDSFRLSLTANGFSDRGETVAVQAVKITPQRPATASPALLNYPLAPPNARAADWKPGLPDQNDRFYQFAARGEYDLSPDITLVSLTAYSHFKTDSAYDPDGLTLSSADYFTNGTIRSFSEELRLAGQTGPLTWIIGGNYQKDKAFDQVRIDVSQSSQTPTIPGVTPQISEYVHFSEQRVETIAGFANVELQVSDALKLQAAARYTSAKRDFVGCVRGDVGLERTLETIQTIFNNAVFGTPAFTPIPRGGCVTLGPVGTTAATSFIPTLVTGKLDEDNISWRAGASFDISPSAFLYANVSKGFKSGSFPTLTASASIQYRPVTQESVLAYEAGVKLTLPEGLGQLNGSAFYYDYADKQFLGTIKDPIFNALGALVNIPKSRVQGVEASASLQPVDGLVLNVAGTYIDAVIKRGTGFNSSAQLIDFAGRDFPYSPKFQFTADGQYQWQMGTSGLEPFVGFSVLHSSKTNASLGGEADFQLPAYTLLDLRAGIENRDKGWKLLLWGRNVTNDYYWVNSLRRQDAVVRYAGRPVTYGVTFSKTFR